MRARLETAGALVGAGDHGANKSLYAKDPDGLEFEVMWLVPRDLWGDEEHEAIIRPLDLDAERRPVRVRLTPLSSPAVAEPSIEIVTEVTPELATAMRELIPQLSSSAPPLTDEQLVEIVTSPATFLFLARLDGRVVGSLTLVLFRLPTGIRAWIEDVVVDGTARGRGVGEALNRAAIDTADERGARTVDLTSRPSREAANRLYQRLGFKERESTVYRYGG